MSSISDLAGEVSAKFEKLSIEETDTTTAAEQKAIPADKPAEARMETAEEDHGKQGVLAKELADGEVKELKEKIDAYDTERDKEKERADKAKRQAVIYEKEFVKLLGQVGMELANAHGIERETLKEQAVVLKKGRDSWTAKADKEEEQTETLEMDCDELKTLTRGTNLYEYLELCHERILPRIVLTTMETTFGLRDGITAENLHPWEDCPWIQSCILQRFFNAYHAYHCRDKSPPRAFTSPAGMLKDGVEGMSVSLVTIL